MNIKKVNLAEKFSLFQDAWNPRIAGELNGQHIKLAKFKDDFIWHKHDHEDEMFLVISGEMKMELHDKTVYVKPGEFIIIPKGVEHKPSAEQEAHVLLFEPASVVNTGDVKNEWTRENLEKI